MLKQIALVDAVKRVINGHRVFMMMEIDPHTTIEDLSFSDGFIVIEEDPQPEAKPEAKPEPKPTQPKAKAQPSVDHGKIMALHNAGWSTIAIAKEMGCTGQTVRNHIAQDKDGTSNSAE